MKIISLQTAISYIQKGDKCLLHFTDLDVYNTLVTKTKLDLEQRNCLRYVNTFRFWRKEFIAKDSLEYYLNNRSFEAYTLYKVVAVTPTISYKE